ncbi:MAG TPA: ROK family protein [Acidimicrobiales bacterium]|nr:ROK family protein [Acidimicrobiales bacterium]
MATWGAVDMGSSGARVARVRIEDTTTRLDSEVTFIDKSVGRRAFVKALRAGLADVTGADLAGAEPAGAGVTGVGVAIAGPTDPSTGEVLFAGAYPWAKGPLASRLARKLDVPVTVVNDAEAHLSAHIVGHAHPLICLTLGTALGFAMTDAAGAVRRPRPDADWEFGHVFLTPPAPGDDETDAARAKIFWALGSRGLGEAQDRHGDSAGAQQFAADLATFVYNLSMTFQPRTIVLAGGIAASIGDVLAPASTALLERRWPPAVRWKPPTVLVSPHGGTSGLLGAAVVAATASTR